ncbi:hypothetical protein [Streptomyces sp. NPDC048142]|uniref:hypothetical protein n=1 Tax=Streptomyces sp. NPDC048142 TaxID=3365501 RepID=UPI003712F136
MSESTSSETKYAATKAEIYREMSTGFLKTQVRSYASVTSDLSDRGWDPKTITVGHEEINAMITELERRGEL